MTAESEDVEALVARYLPALRSFVRLRMGGELRAREESCDIVQSVAREVLQHRDRFRYGGEQGFREWLFTTAHRKVVDRLDHWRAGRRRGPTAPQLPEELAGLGPSPSQQASAREQLAAVERAFDGLAAEQRDIVVWSKLMGWSHADIAARLGKSEVAVRKSLSRALARLAARLDGGDEPAAPDPPGA
ncbi:MAG: sigma-70 family RNA polymerase sigma factor [Planctomycetes bacterium]|nr:sigma-70 family RNA polymerase sigma factor [Planctomycetota bacterium]